MKSTVLFAVAAFYAFALSSSVTSAGGGMSRAVSKSRHDIDLAISYGAVPDLDRSHLYSDDDSDSKPSLPVKQSSAGLRSAKGKLLRQNGRPLNSATRRKVRHADELFRDTGVVTLFPVDVPKDLVVPKFSREAVTDTHSREFNRYTGSKPAPRRMVAGAIVLNKAKDKVLLVTTKTGKWGLPKGGWDTTDVEITDGIGREVFEEAGVIVTMDKRLGVWKADSEDNGPTASTLYQATEDEVLDKYPEQEGRKRIWASFEMALELLGPKKSFMQQAIYVSDVKRNFVQDKDIDELKSKKDFLQNLSKLLKLSEEEMPKPF